MFNCSKKFREGPVRRKKEDYFFLILSQFSHVYVPKLHVFEIIFNNIPQQLCRYGDLVKRWATN